MSDPTGINQYTKGSGSKSRKKPRAASVGANNIMGLARKASGAKLRARDKVEVVSDPWSAMQAHVASFARPARKTKR